MSESITSRGPERGLDRHYADRIQAQIQEWVKNNKEDYLTKSQNRPFIRLFEDDRSFVKDIVIEFFKNSNTKPIAELLGIPHNQFKKECLANAWIIINVHSNQEWPQLPQEGVRYQVQSFVALGPCSYQTGLCALGEPPRHFELVSGDAIHTSVKEYQRYSGKGISYELVLAWKVCD